VEHAEQAIRVGGFSCTLFLVTNVQSLAGRHACDETLYWPTSGRNGIVMTIRQTGLPGIVIRVDKGTVRSGAGFTRDVEVHLPCGEEETRCEVLGGWWLVNLMFSSRFVVVQGPTSLGHFSAASSHLVVQINQLLAHI